MSWATISIKPDGSFITKCEGGFRIEEKTPCTHNKKTKDSPLCDFLAPGGACVSFNATSEIIKNFQL